MVWEALASYVYPSGVKKKPGIVFSRQGVIDLLSRQIQANHIYRFNLRRLLLNHFYL